MYEGLVKRLRNKGCQICPICREAAEAIDELSREIDIDNAAMTAMDAAMPHWIPVTERLPEMGKEVLVSDKHKGVNIAWIVGCFSKDGASFEWACESDGWIDDQLPITHWMPLPGPPKEET